MVEVEKQAQHSPEQTRKANEIIAASLILGEITFVAHYLAFKNFTDSGDPAGNALQVAALASFFWLTSHLAVSKSLEYLKTPGRTNQFKKIVSSAPIIDL